MLDSSLLKDKYIFLPYLIIFLKVALKCKHGFGAHFGLRFSPLVLLIVFLLVFHILIL